MFKSAGKRSSESLKFIAQVHVRQGMSGCWATGSYDKLPG